MKIDRSGFIANYLVSGPRATDFMAPNNDSSQLCYEQRLRTMVAERGVPLPQEEIVLGGLSGLGMPWQYYYSYGNWFVDKSTFYSTLQKVELDAVTELVAEADMEATAVFWTYAAITAWCNGEKVCVVDCPVYKPIQKQSVTLRLKKGHNRLYVKLQALGVRDTRTLFGIQLVPGGGCSGGEAPTSPVPSGQPTGQALSGLRVSLPDWGRVKALYQIEQWLGGMKMEHSVLLFSQPAPVGAKLGYDNNSPDYADVGKRIVWEALTGKRQVTLDKTKTGTIHISAGWGGHALARTLENIAAQVPAYANLNRDDENQWEENKQAILKRIADTLSLSRGDKFGFSISNVLARKALGKFTEADELLLAETLDQIEARYDCSDFLLCGVIRYMKRYPLPPNLGKRAKEVLLNYRYWMDQEGSDAMCFWSENHALMFYACAMHVGDMYPDDMFPRSGKTGAELSAEGRERVRFWLADVKAHGFEEFLSTVYMCVTFAALLNVIDFSDKEISGQAAEVTDTLLRMLSKHTFDGAVLAPMGRVYREVIHPFRQGAQALMNLIDPEVPFSYGEGWLGFYATSHYQLPRDLKMLMHQPANEAYPTGNALVCLNKQQEYCLTSVQSPRTDAGFKRWENVTFTGAAAPASCEYTKSLNERFHGTTCFEPGVYGYQQHLWHAALDQETGVFTNHPGASCEDSPLRPGFWHGNGVMPAITQRENEIGIVYHIPDGHPIHFTHAYVPMAKFDETELGAHWLFARKKDGYLALWCSVAMEPADDQLFGCELRSYGDDVAYYCVCEKAAHFADFADFIAQAEQNAPVFDTASKTLKMRHQDGQGQMVVCFMPSQDQTQYI